MSNKTMTGSYPFNAAEKTLDLSSITGFDRRQLRYIHNLSTRQDMYDMGNTAHQIDEDGGIVTFTMSTSDMTDGDLLEIIYDDHTDGGSLNALAAGVAQANKAMVGGAGITWTTLNVATSAAVSFTPQVASFAPSGSTTSSSWVSASLKAPRKFRARFEYDGAEYANGFLTMGVIDPARITLDGVMGSDLYTGAWNGFYGTFQGVFAAGTHSPQAGPGNSVLLTSAPMPNRGEGVFWMDMDAGKMAIMTHDHTVHDDVQDAVLGLVDTATAVFCGYRSAAVGPSSFTVTGKPGIPDGVTDPSWYTEGAPGVDVFAGQGLAVNDQQALATLRNIDAKTPALIGGNVPVAVETTVTVQAPAGAALALDSSVQAVIAAIKATVNIAGSVWFDPTTTPPTYYVRRESVNETTGAVTVAWFTPGGAAASPTVSNLSPVANAAAIVNETLVYTATGSGTGYSISDVLIHGYGIDTAATTPSVVYSIWLNATTGAVLASAPSSANYTAATQTVTDAALGGTSAAAAGNTGASTTNGFLRWMRDFWYARLGALASALSLSVVLASDDAQIGVDGTGISQPTGGSGIRGWLSGIFSLLKGVLTITPYNAILATYTDTWTATGQTATHAKVAGVNFIELSLAGTTGLIFSVSVTLNNGSIVNMLMSQRSTGGGTRSISVTTSVFVAQLPSDWASVTLTTSGSNSSMTSTLNFISNTTLPQAALVNLNADTVRVGQVAPVVIAFTETTAGQSANTTVNGSARTPLGSYSSGASVANTSAYPKTFAAFCQANTSGCTLYILASVGGSNYVPVAAGVALSQQTLGGNYGASLEVPVSAPNMKAVVTTGGSAPTTFELLTIMKG